MLLGIAANLVFGHGAMNAPMPRSSRGVPASSPSEGPSCIGEACFWFSVGCFSGCERCRNEGQEMYMTPSQANCSAPLAPQLPDAFRTFGTPRSNWSDYFPWRSPGTAPVADACGAAGGFIPGAPGGRTPANPVPQGVPQFMPGSQLPPTVAPAQWVAGAAEEVSWALYVNHGGGYAYRLCPQSEALTEACFQLRPLAFVGDSTTVRYTDGRGELTIGADTVTAGTHPAGSSWRRNPIPACNCDMGQQCTWPPEAARGPAFAAYGNASAGRYPRCPTGLQFEPPPFPEAYGFGGRDDPIPNPGIFRWSLVDRVRVPADLAPGNYTLGFRWDCEQTAQVWSSCADITVVAAPAPTPTPAPAPAVAAAAAVAAPPLAVDAWPSGAAGALSLTFDDGFFSQLRYLAPLLQKHGGMNATFYAFAEAATQPTPAPPAQPTPAPAPAPAPPNGGRYMDWSELRQLAAMGHEIGSHTMDHADLPTIPLSGGGGDNATWELGRTLVEWPAHGLAKPVTLAYPDCDTNAAVSALARSLFTAARGCGEPTPNARTPPDMAALNSWFPQVDVADPAAGEKVMATAQQFLQAAAQSGGWSVLGSHEVVPQAQIRPGNPSAGGACVCADYKDDCGADASSGCYASWWPVPVEFWDFLLSKVADAVQQKQLWVAPLGTVAAYVALRDSVRVLPRSDERVTPKNATHAWTSLAVGSSGAHAAGQLPPVSVRLGVPCAPGTGAGVDIVRGNGERFTVRTERSADGSHPACFVTLHMSDGEGILRAAVPVAHP